MELRPVVLLAAALVAAPFEPVQDPTARADLVARIEAIRAEAGVPALGGAFVTVDGLEGVWVTGLPDPARVITVGQGFVKPEQIVQVIDDWFTNRRLALVFEVRVGRGRLLVSSVDFSNDLDPVRRQLLASLLTYANSSAFAPTVSVTVEQVRALMAAQ